MNPHHRIFTFTSAAILSCSLSLQAQNLVQNGSLELGQSPTIWGNATLIDRDIYTSNYVDIPNWRIAASGVALATVQVDVSVPSLNNPTMLYGGTGSPDGGQFFSVWTLANPANETVQVSLSQSISGLSIGQEYQLTFYQSITVGPENIWAPYNSNWHVSLGSSTQNSPIMTLPTTSGAGIPGTWQQVSMNFTATNTTQILSFLSGPVGLPQYLMLDGISMVAVPEPSAAVLVGLTGIGMIFSRRRRRLLPVSAS